MDGRKVKRRKEIGESVANNRCDFSLAEMQYGHLSKCGRNEDGETQSLQLWALV